MDSFEYPERYIGKEIEFKAQAYRPRGMKEDMFVPVREIMTCCADDISPYGYPCKMKEKHDLVMKAWYKITARFEFEASEGYGRRQPMLYLTGIEKTEAPEEKIVYLG